MIRPVAADGRIETGGAFTPIRRPRVLERIAAAAAQRIVLLVAPAGYGKSVALRQYLETLEEPVVRFDVHAEHRTLLGFVRGFADALIAVAPDARKTVSGAYERSCASKTPGADLAMWLHAHVKTFTGVFALDDLHVAEEDPEISKFLVSLIERTAGRGRWVIASRSTLDLPVGTWLAYGQMDLNIDEQDLRFTAEEARAAAKASRVAVRDDELNDILSMTEGWPTALSFALRTSTRSTDLRNVAASTREMIYRYLAEQVYRSLSDDERDVLHFVAYLPEIEIDVLRRAGYKRAKALLESLRDRVAFVYRDRPGVYRCHDLFRDFLQHQLELDDDATAEAVQIRVARALEAAGRLPAALTLYAQCRSVEQIQRILHDSGFDLMEQGHADAVACALDALPQDVRATDPTVLGMRAQGEADLGRFDRAESLFARALNRIGDRPARARLAIRLALLLINQGRDVIDLLEPLRDPKASPSMRAEIVGLLAVAYARARRAAEAREAIDEAERFVGELEDDHDRAKVLHRIGAAGLHLNLPSAWIASAQSRAAALASDQGLYGLAGRAFNALASQALLHESDITKMTWYAQQAATAAQKAGDRFSLQTALLQMLDAESRRGNAERLRSLEQQFTGTATTDAKRMSYIILPRAVMAAWDGDFEEAARLVASAADLGYYDFDRAYNTAMYALYLISAGKRERALEAAAKALEIAHAADCGSVHGATMCEFARLLCAAVEALAGRLTHASRILQRRTPLHSPGTDALRAVGMAVVRAAKSPALRDDLREPLLELDAAGYGGVGRVLELAAERCLESAQASGDVSLTKSEMEVLVSLGKGLTPKDIARETGRSIYTVQAHIANVIRKLGCSGRNEALASARKRGLLA